MPLEEPPPLLLVPLNLRQCRATMRAIGYVMKVDAAEADHLDLVSSLGSISRVVRDHEEGKAE